MNLAKPIDRPMRPTQLIKNSQPLSWENLPVTGLTRGDHHSRSSRFGQGARFVNGICRTNRIGFRNTRPIEVRLRQSEELHPRFGNAIGSPLRDRSWAALTKIGDGARSVEAVNDQVGNWVVFFVHEDHLSTLKAAIQVYLNESWLSLLK